MSLFVLEFSGSSSPRIPWNIPSRYGELIVAWGGHQLVISPSYIMIHCNPSMSLHHWIIESHHRIIEIYGHSISIEILLSFMGKSTTTGWCLSHLSLWKRLEDSSVGMIFPFPTRSGKIQIAIHQQSINHPQHFDPSLPSTINQINGHL